jgi:hypothetical protein
MEVDARVSCHQHAACSCLPAALGMRIVPPQTTPEQLCRDAQRAVELAVMGVHSSLAADPAAPIAAAMLHQTDMLSFVVGCIGYDRSSALQQQAMQVLSCLLQHNSGWEVEALRQDPIPLHLTVLALAGAAVAAGGCCAEAAGRLGALPVRQVARAGRAPCTGL